jgi:phage/plasmid-like protein (TIGR03299 family)
MSRENAKWLNTNTLIGDTEKRGNAWHYRADLQEGAGNHYAGAIPMDDINKLFAPWEPVSAPLFINVPCSADDDQVSGIDANGQPYRTIELPDRKAITPIGHPESVLGIFSKEGYEIHGYQEWLVKGLANLVDNEVHFSSAGVLMGGGVGWAELTITESQSVADFPFIPHVLAFTSVNGKYATDFRRSVQAVVCDNTLSAAASENGPSLKVKHTKNSKLRLQNARDALKIVLNVAEDFTAEVERLTAWKVTDKEWSKFLDLYVPLKTEDGKEPSKMSVTKVENKRERLTAMYRNDMRCAPWNGNAFGVVQTANTWNHHERATYGDTDRAERNMLSAVNGDTDKETTRVLNALTMATA